tara:strand:- start:26 stop:514 length:489 start_codon:yes stop_codon:yes gene_type:complete
MSTLKVDSLVEKTSGNGVHIAGHVIQVKETFDLSSVGPINISSNSLTATGIICSITPKYSNSKILIDWRANMADHPLSYGYGRMFLKVGSGSYSAMSGTGDYNAGYLNSTHNRYTSLSFSGQYQPTSTDILYFQPYYVSHANTLTVVHSNSSYSLRLMEIAQ